MKIKILAIIGLALFLSNAKGQDSKYLIGLKVSPGLSNLSNSMCCEEYRFSYAATFSCEYLISNSLSAKLEIGYERIKPRYSGIAFIDENGNIDTKRQFILKFDYLVFPIYASYKSKGRTHLIIDFGPHLGYLLRQTYKIDPALNGVSDNNNYAGSYNRLNIGIIGAIGLGFPISNKTTCNTGIKGNYGITGLGKNSGDMPSVTINTVGLYFEVTYKI